MKKLLSLTRIILRKCVTNKRRFKLNLEVDVPTQCLKIWAICYNFIQRDKKVSGLSWFFSILFCYSWSAAKTQSCIDIWNSIKRFYKEILQMYPSISQFWIKEFTFGWLLACHLRNSWHSYAWQIYEKKWHFFKKINLIS